MDIGLVLSGGGARGLAHIGVLKALEERHLKPVAISGCSMGAIIGAFHGAGLSSGKMHKFIKKHQVPPFSSSW